MKKILIVILFFAADALFSQSVVINEVMASNDTTIYDEDDDASDWIEFYNSGLDTVNLNGCYLSDDSLNIKKWRFGDAPIEPGKYLVVFASDKDTFMNYWHTNFKINASGEKIIFSDSGGVIIDQVNVPASLTDVSYGRAGDGSSAWIFQVPSPGNENTGNSVKDYSDSVRVSLPGGFYPSGVLVQLSAAGDIYYTLDGSDPDASSSKYYGPININKTTVLKAINIETDHIASPVIYESYFINEDTDLPVISLISDPYNLFDYNYGIYADGPGWTPNTPNFGANFWMDWERPAHIEFFDDNKNKGFSEDCGIAIYGAWTRANPQKSFSVKFKDPYNSSSLDYPLFPGFYVATFKSFILRNSGNDFYYTHIRDAMMQTLIKELDLDYLEYRPAAAYINGEYWGIYNIREKINEHYIANRYQIDPDSIDILEENMEVVHGDSLDYSVLIDYLKTHDMSTKEALNYIRSKIDLDNCLLYFAAQVYYNNQDWPSGNIKYWRERSKNGKWRWILYDLDFGFNLYETNGQAENHLSYLLSGIETRPGSNPPWSTFLPRKLMENPVIENIFINLIADLLNTNFKSERVIKVINEMNNHIANEAVKHRQRWGLSQYTADDHIKRMISFAKDRPGYLRGFVRNFFNCGPDGILTISSTKGGKIKLNSLNLDIPDSSWSGTYFQGNEIHLKAIPSPGYKFNGWSGSVTSDEDSIKVSVAGTTSLQAVFSIDSSLAGDIVINEINYNSSEDFDSGDWIELYNRSDRSINISNWYFSDSDDNHKFILQEGTAIEPGEYIVLVENDSSFTSCFPDVKNYIGETGFGLSGSGEFMKLVNNEGEIIDSLTYDNKSPWPEEADGSGSSLELIDAVKDNSIAQNWNASNGHGTPGNINSTTITNVDNDFKTMPADFLLYQNYPNPFNPSTHIGFALPSPGKVKLTVYNLLGQLVTTIADGEYSAGTHLLLFKAENLASGIYYYRIKAGINVRTKKMILIK